MTLDEANKEKARLVTLGISEEDIEVKQSHPTFSDQWDVWALLRGPFPSNPK